ncbi:hypothetical protein CHLNCDRAFT_139983 [Chlorella variabilis]|uniref:MYND-type domain-containing protein n=1 Tax=Chlorella variabilis TaxID=554065 RepID=E1ZRB5_CHLVA|nr:hypothetical protein CHLNCDRAFT_139983 [Chlorella variabilis]EFN51540.1 hypothetical protein CHLNCDRAFT_139983 [Chlorella variabilis]|eukprot:XP_005843642.1 hypothetical protein CHLNCDRAFT_139983 [Chlorella variabilis]
MALQDVEGLTPRMRAIMDSQLEAARLLLELEQQQAGWRQRGAPSSRAPRWEQAEARGTAPASSAAAEAAAEAAAAQLLAEEEREEEEQATRQAAKAAKRQRQKERQRQRAAVSAGEADETATGQAAVEALVPHPHGELKGHLQKQQRQRLEAAAVSTTEPMRDPLVAADGHTYERAVGEIATGQAAVAEPTPQQAVEAVEAAAGVRVCAAEGCGNTSGLHRCSGRRAVRYCSEACSHAHGKAHKAECRRLRTAAGVAQP